MIAKNGKEAYLAEAKEVSKRRRLQVVAEGTEGAKFKIERNKEGEIKRTCEPVKVGSGCSSGSW